MKQWIPLIVLTLGLGIASASGALNGADHTAYRQAIWTVENADDAKLVSEAKQVIERGVPQPGTRVAQWFDVGGAGWLFGVGLIVVGAVMARRQQAEAFAGGGDGGSEEALDFAGSLDLLRGRVEQVRAAIAETPMDDTAPEARETLDIMRLELIDPVVDRRGQLIAMHGLAGFAEYFSPFSSAERQLNRAWSALTDGYPPVARQALDDAATSLAQASDAFERVSSAG